MVIGRVILAGYSTPLRWKLIQRLQELEGLVSQSKIKQSLDIPRRFPSRNRRPIPSKP